MEESSTIAYHTISGVAEGAEPFVIAKQFEQHQRLMYVALDDARLHRIKAALSLLFPKLPTLLMPAWDSIPYDRVSPNMTVTTERIRTLTKLSQLEANDPAIVLTTINAMTQKVLPRDMVEGASYTLKVDKVLDRAHLTHFLVENGYDNVGAANEAGEFAVRGSIIDIVPPNDEYGYRLDFFGDTLESIRLYNPLSQISGEKVKQLELIPASEVLLNEQTIEQFRHQYRELFGSTVKGDPLYETVSEGRKYTGMEQWQPLFYESMESLLDYVPNAKMLLGHMVEEARIEHDASVREAYDTRVRHEKEAGKEGSYHPLPPEKLYILEHQWQLLPQTQSAVQCSPFEVPDALDSILAKPSPNFYNESKAQQKTTFDALKDWLPQAPKFPIIIACMSEGSRDRMQKLLAENDVKNELVQSSTDWQKLTHIGLALLPYDQGVLTDDLTIISEADILGERIFRTAKRKKSAEQFLSEASQLDAGELVVHKENGIGRFEGLETMTVLGETHDFILLTYQDGDKLYVPVENIDLISKYGGEGEGMLDKLGGLGWQQRTALLKKRIKVTAKELMEVAAKRSLNKAKTYETGPAYEEFCNRFPYSETEDQLAAIEDVVEDLQSGQAMDRLICGDVGFGKTEVALRAAFIVANPDQGEENAQVALIAPTTLLARQHAETFRKRFEGLPIQVAEVSRMKTEKQLREAREQIAEGKIDIVIGTHAVLSKEVQFANLGMVIVDEEQRFGVAQKEKLKRIKANTHVLTMTATPIPRTLQLSMTGIRDLSLITTPPIDRLAVRTFVMPFDGVVVREAILREHYRGGRSFYVCPRVKDVEEMESKLKDLIPEVKIVSAHGQMPAEKLDKIMNAFYDGQYDVLLATTIIESGIDVPEANTLIVHRADMYGLSQLYQIRGRVGRSKVRAYAYLTLPPRKTPTQQAMKRLEVMQKLDTLGAGFTLASHDMDIRGFGNLLGDEQSGNIKEVGVELYQAMLRDAISEFKALGEGQEIQETFSPKIKIATSVLIPESYIKDLSLRLGLYKRIAHLDTDEAIESIGAELVDRFGDMPKEVTHLLDVMKLKLLCIAAGISKLDASQVGASVQFFNDTVADPVALMEFVARHPHDMKVRGKDQALIIKNRKWQTVEDRVKGVKELIEQLMPFNEVK